MSEFGALDQFFAKRTLKDAYTPERAAFLSTLMQQSRAGHLCIESLNAPALPDHILEVGTDLQAKTPVVRDGNRYYLQKNWFYETFLLAQVKRLLSHAPAKISDETIVKQEVEKTSFLPKQLEAIERALKSSFTIICGGPGTGKTYTAAAFVRSLKASSSKKLKIYLTAPTGKAASHLKSIIGDETLQAMTLHRLLRLQPGINHTKPKKIDADLVIVDEASMLDVPLLAKTLEAIGDETRLILIGDPDQLPPIEAGSIFREMTALFGITLEKSMRIENQALNTLAESVNRGELNVSSYLIDLPFDQNLSTVLFERINPIVSEKEPDPIQCLEKLNQFRILGALRQGPYGTEALNQQLIRELGIRILPCQWWAIPIMITKNTPSLDLYNGSSGILIGKSLKGVNLREATAYFPKKIPFKELPPFEIAFCLSIHKSQGSEFESVLALFPKGSENFGREALYTAVTRAKKSLEIMAEDQVLEMMLPKRSCKTSGFTIRF